MNFQQGMEGYFGVFLAMFLAIIGILTKTAMAFIRSKHAFYWAKKAVLFAEDMYKHEDGDVKLKKACEWLSEHSTVFGVKIPESSIESLIRTAYQEIHGIVVGNIQTSVVDLPPAEAGGKLVGYTDKPVPADKVKADQSGAPIPPTPNGISTVTNPAPGQDLVSQQPSQSSADAAPPVQPAIDPNTSLANLKVSDLQNIVKAELSK